MHNSYHYNIKVSNIYQHHALLHHDYAQVSKKTHVIEKITY